MRALRRKALAYGSLATIRSDSTCSAHRTRDIGWSLNAQETRYSVRADLAGLVEAHLLGNTHPTRLLAGGWALQTSLRAGQAISLRLCRAV